MGCGCKKKPRQEPMVIPSDVLPPQSVKIPQTPEELHQQEMMVYAQNLKIAEAEMINKSENNQ